MATRVKPIRCLNPQLSLRRSTLWEGDSLLSASAPHPAHQFHSAPSARRPAGCVGALNNFVPTSTYTQQYSMSLDTTVSQVVSFAGIPNPVFRDLGPALLSAHRAPAVVASAAMLLAVPYTVLAIDT